MLKQNCCLSGPHFPPPAIVEVLQDYVTNYHKVRRLHLIVVLDQSFFRPLWLLCSGISNLLCSGILWLKWWWALAWFAHYRSRGTACRTWCSPIDDYPWGCPMHTQSPAHHHWGWPWLCIFPPSSPPPGLSSLLFFLLSGRPARLESKAIQIQSDHPLAFSPPVAAMERSKVICSIQVWGRDVGLSSQVSLDFAGLGSPCSWAPLLFLLLDVALLHRRPPHLWDGQVHLVVEDSLVSFFSPPFSLLPKSVWVAFWRHYSLFFPIFLSSMCCSFLPSSSWADTACTGDDFRDAYSLGATDCVSGFPPFGHLYLQWSGWASLLAGEELLRGIWVSARCMPSSSVSRGFTKSWVGQVALRSPTNRHALDLTVSLDDQGQ